MNKAYQTIWSTVKQRWVVVAENVKRGSGPLGVLLAVCCLLASGTADALPVNPQVVSGTANFSNNGSTLTITNSANAIINWQKFSIAANETTRFMQPSALSAVLNRVTGGDPSAIYGALQSNGKIFLINQNGILFGPGARVDVNGLVASTLNIANEDFLAGRMKFIAGPLAGRVENQGVITTPGGGQVYLIAPDVQNSGIITAPNGDILLAAGKEVLLVDHSSPEIAVVVTAPEGQALNLGSLTAEAGRIGLYGSVVRQAGLISANSAVQDAQGRIFLKSTQQTVLEGASWTTANGPIGGMIVAQSTDGTTFASGVVEARGISGLGGTVALLGRNVGLMDQCSVDVSGRYGGGSVLVGGDYQGTNPAVQNALATYVATNVKVAADALENGDGGKIIVWSDATTQLFGALYARGGQQNGNGGFIETSSRGYLDYRGTVDTSAQYGMRGTFLLDPASIVIAAGVGNGGGTMPNTTTTFTGYMGNVAGSVLVSDFDPTTIYQSQIEGQSASTNIVLQASGGITTSGVFSTPITLASGSNLTLQTRNDASSGDSAAGINISAAEFVTQGAGNIAIQTGVLGAISPLAAPVIVGKLSATGGTIRLTSSGDITLTNTVAAAGMVSLTANGAISQNAGALINSTSLRATGMSVVLNEANYVGVISGGATGVGANDRFEYTSVNQVTLDTVDGVSGVSAAVGGSNPLGIRLVSSGQGINQNSGATVQASGRGLELSAVNDIMLADPGNTFGSVVASSTSASVVALASASNLTIPYLGAGVATINAGPVGGVQIAAPSLNLAGEIVGAGNYLMTDNLTVAGTAKVTASDPTAGTTIAPVTANRPITVGTACVGGIPCLLLTDVSEARFIGGNGLAIGESDPMKLNLAGDITITSPVSRPTSGLALLTGGSISQTASISSLGVVAVAGGAVNLGHASNAFGGVAVDSAGGGVSIVSSNPLTVGLFSAPGFVTVNGIASNNNPISIASSGGALDLQAPVDAGTSTVTLSSAGPLTASAGVIIGSQLNATATGGISLYGMVPQVSLSNSGSGNISYWNQVASGATLQVSATSSAAGGMVNIGEAMGNLTLLGASTNNGDLEVFVPSGNVTINGNLAAGSGWLYVEGLNVTHQAGTISGNSVDLRATNPGTGTLTLASTVNATQSIDLEADNLILNSPTLTVANASIQNEIGIRPTSAGRSITIGGTGSGLNVTTTSDSVFSAPTLVIGDDGTDMYSIAAGPITVASPIVRSQRLALVSGSTITQASGATITANEFGVIAGGNVTFTEPGNAVANFVAELTSGSVSFSNSSPFSVVQVVGGIENPKTITGVSTVGGNVTLTSAGGGITLAAPVDASAGAVTLTAAGSIVDNTGSVGVYGGSLSASAGGDIGSSARSLFSQVSQWANLTAGGSVYAENYGAVTTGAAAVTASSGGVLLKAHSPLTIGTGGVVATGDVYLEAVSSGAGDDLTINGPVTSKAGSITLKAANYVVKGTGSSASAPGVITVIDLNGTTTSSGSGGVTPPPSDQPIVPPPDLQPLPPEAPLYSDPAASGQTMQLASVTTSTEPTTTAVTDSATTTDAGVTNGDEQAAEDTDKEKANGQKTGDKPSKEDKTDAKPKKKNYCN